MPIEQTRSGSPAQFGKEPRLAALADVDDTLQHRLKLAHSDKPAGLRAGGRATLASLVANIFGPDLMIVVIIAVVLLSGAGQLPKLARSVGEASKEFKKSQQEAEQEAKAQAAAQAHPASDDKITLSKTELDALLAEREARARRETD